MRIFTSVAVLGLAAAGLSAVPANAATVPLKPAAAKPPVPKPGLADFNRDGFGDLVIGAPNATVGGRKGAGSVTVLYGSRRGVLDSKHRQNLSQNSPGVPDAAEADDRFGYATTVADLNGDGYSDLAVGAPHESRPNAWRAGLVTVFLGGPKRLRPAIGFWDVPRGGDLDLLGASLATGDIDGDGIADLAATGGHTMMVTGSRPETRKTTRSPLKADGPPSIKSGVAIGDVNRDGFADVAWNIHGGPLSLALGSKNGTMPDREVVFDAGLGQLAMADVNGDGFADLAVGRPGAAGGGQVAVYPGLRSGKLGRARTFSQNTPGVPGKGAAGDGFGTSLVVRDATGDRRAELVAGAPGKDVRGRKDAGAAFVLRGQAQWALGRGSWVLTQGPSAEAGDRFGGAVTLFDFNGDRKLDLAVGAPGENRASGALTRFLNARSRQFVTFGPATVGVSPAGARFGASLSR